MLKLKIKKEELKYYLTPFSINESPIFSQTFLGKEGFFGIKDNVLIFISMEKIEDELSIEYPADITEIQAFLTTADYLVQRIMMSDRTLIPGLEDIPEHDIKIESLKILNNFINNFKENNYLLEKIKHNET